MARLHHLCACSLIQESVGRLFSSTVCSRHLSWEESLYVSGRGNVPAGDPTSQPRRQLVPFQLRAKEM